MEERLQKIIARAGIASRRHAELLILSGQVRVNGQVVRELGTKADAAKDRIEAAGKVVDSKEGRRVYILLNKPPEVVSAMADPEQRKTLRNFLRGLPERVFPVGNLEYAASGLVFLTNDGDLAAEMLKNWAQIEQVYHVKVKGMLTLPDLERLGKEIGVQMQTVRQPDASRGRAENFWYEARMRDSKKEEMRRVLVKEQHPVEKLKRIGLGPLTVEGIPRGRYRMLGEKEVVELKKVISGEWRVERKDTQKKEDSAEAQSARRDAEKRDAAKRFAGNRDAAKRYAGKRDAGKSDDGKVDAMKRYEGNRGAAKRYAGKRDDGKSGHGDGNAQKRYGGKRYTGKRDAGKSDDEKRNAAKRYAGNRDAAKGYAGKRGAGKRDAVKKSRGRWR